MKNFKIALALIVKPTDEEADMLFRALENIKEYVDGIFITITGENKKCEEVCKSFNANISHYKWDYSFANARNYNFSQVPKDYTHIMWMDADDCFRGLEGLREIIEQNPDTDGFTMNYLYSFDADKNPVVVHLKTMVVKNGCVRWAGDLHEDFAENRKVSIKFIKSIERLHLASDEQFESKKERNLEIAGKIVEKEPNDPRSYWNLANSQKAMGLYKEAVESFDKFLGMSMSDDEKYIALLRMTEIYLNSVDYKKALDTIKIAIGTKPEYPDAYHLKGHIYFQMGDYPNARDCYLLGLKQKPPVYSIIVYNPRDYDYYPLKALAKTYYSMNLPSLASEALRACVKIMPSDKESEKLIKVFDKESKKLDKVLGKIEKLNKIKDKDKLKDEIDKLPDDIRSHPAICRIRNQNFIKKESSGKDIVFFCGFTSEPWTPDIAKEKGIGGSEEAVINLTKELVNKGWNVEVYNNCGHKEQSFDGVKYKPFWMWNYRDKQDIVVLWRSPKPLDWEINSDKVIVDLHDCINPGEFTEERLQKLSKIMVKSKAQRDLYPEIPDEKFCIIPNPINTDLFNQEVERDPYLIINHSSPDRGLSACLDIIEETIKRLPKDIADKTKFIWHYGWSVFDSSRTTEAEQSWAKNVKQRFNTLKEKGIVDGGGRINHEEVAKENLKAGVLLYPSEFYEIDYMGGSKAQIAGAMPITTDFASIGEKIQYGVKIHSEKTKENWDRNIVCDFSVKDEEMKEQFIQALVNYLKNPTFDREEMSKWAKEKFDTKTISNEWDKQLCQILAK